MEQQSQAQAPPDIFEASNRCLDLFTEYLESPATGNKDVAENLQSRFSLWAAYTGAFAAAGASLDDRLQYHDEIQRMVMALLYMLQRNLQSGAYS